MKRVLLEFFLCLFVAIISVVLFILFGLFYDASEHVILINILVWTGIVAISYLSLIFIPFWKKKKEHFVDLLAFASGYLGVLIACLARTKTLDEYSYVTILPFIASFLGTAELVIKTQRLIEEKTLDPKNRNVLDKLNDESLEVKKEAIFLINIYQEKGYFTIEQAMVSCKRRKKSIERLLKICEENRVFKRKIGVNGELLFEIYK